MQTLPQPDDSPSEARSVSEILARANPADMPAMRAGLSFLTSAGAELAVALERSQQENQRLMAIVSALPPEWVQAAVTGGAFPDYSSLRAELELAKDERIDLRGQLVERDQQIQALQEQFVELRALPEAPPALEASAEHQAQLEDLNSQLAALQAELDGAGLARIQAEEGLKTSESELADVEQQLADLSAELWDALPEEARTQIATPPAEEAAHDLRQRRATRLGALAAAVSAVVERSKQNEAMVGEANARAAAAQLDLDAVSSDRMALEADLGEKVQTLDHLQTQVENLQSDIEGLKLEITQLGDEKAALQSDLEGALAAKAALEEQLLAREGELAELHQQIDSVAQQLRLVLPEETLAQLAPLSEDAGQEAPDEEGEDATRSAGSKMLGLGAIAAGVAAAVDVSKQKIDEADQASGLLSAVAEEKTTLESALQDKEQAVADLNGQIEALNVQVADLQSQVDAAQAARADVELQLSERDAQLGDLQSQIDGAVSRLQELVPAEDLPEIDALQEGDEALGVRAVGLAALVGGAAHVAERRQSSIAELDSHVQSLQADLDALRAEQAGLEATLADKTQELAGYNDYVLNLQGQVNALAAERSALEADLQIRTESQTQAEAQFEALTAQVNDLTAQVQALTDQAASLQAQLDAAEAAKAETEQALLVTQEQLAAAQADLAAIEVETQGVVGDGVRTMGAVAAGAAAVAAIKEKDEALAAANEQMLALQGQVNELAAASEQVITLQGQLDELARAKADAEAALAERSSEIEALTARMGELEVERDGIVASKEELSASLQGREAELADLSGQLEALQLQMAGIAGERGALQEQVVELEGTLSEVEAQRSAKAPLALASALTEALADKPAFKARAASAAIVAGIDPVLSPAVQALTDVKGIGSAYQQRLYNAGVGTYWELANLPGDDLQEVLKIPVLQRPRFHVEETRLDAYQWAQKTQTVGLLWDGDHVDDFESLPGIGKTFEKRLYEAGITTFEQLAACDVQRLAEIVRAPAMQEVSYDAWIEQANQRLAERHSDQPAEAVG